MERQTGRLSGSPGVAALLGGSVVVGLVVVALSVRLDAQAARPNAPLSGPAPTEALPYTNTGCFGDCNGDGRVTVDEILILINIVLGNAPIDACPLSGDCCHPCPPGVYIDCMLVAISNALTRCPPDPHP